MSSLRPVAVFCRTRTAGVAGIPAAPAVRVEGQGSSWTRTPTRSELDGATGQTIREYTYYPGVDRPHSVRAAHSGAIDYYATDHPGNVVGLINAGQQLENEYRYVHFGEVQVVQENIPQPLRFAAREWDDIPGLYQVRARWYDPQSGRFVSEDPIGLAGGINPYVYANNNPINDRDPSGLEEECIDWYMVTINVETGEVISERLLYTTCTNTGGGQAGSEDSNLTKEQYERAVCVANGYLLDPTKSTVLGMLSRDEIVTGTRPRDAIAWAEMRYSGPPRIIIGGGPFGAFVRFRERDLAETLAHEVWHVYQMIALRQVFHMSGGEAGFYSYVRAAQESGLLDRDAYANEGRDIRQRLLDAPSCPKTTS